jgi:hypothetical protein
VKKNETSGEWRLMEWDEELLDLWYEFSDARYAATFMVVAPDVVREFAEWLERRVARGESAKPGT